MTQNQIAFRNAKELERHNREYENETHRHQVEDERLKGLQIDISKEANAINSRLADLKAQDVEISKGKLYLGYQELMQKERIRQETERANRASEEIKQQQNAINAANLTEQQRHSLVVERLQDQINKSQVAYNAAQAANAYANAELAGANTALASERIDTEIATQNKLEADAEFSTQRANYTMQQALNYGTETSAKVQESKARTAESKAKAKQSSAQTQYTKFQEAKGYVDVFTNTVNTVLNMFGKSGGVLNVR